MFDSLNIGENVERIGSRAFNQCTGFTNTLKIPDSVEIIEEAAFKGCINFNSLIIGESVKTLGGTAFQNCTGLIDDEGVDNKIFGVDNVYYIKNDSNYYCLGKGSNVFEYPSPVPSDPTGTLEFLTGTKVIAD
jgi:hypothetical protein